MIFSLSRSLRRPATALPTLLIWEASWPVARNEPFSLVVRLPPDGEQGQRRAFERIYDLGFRQQFVELIFRFAREILRDGLFHRLTDGGDRDGDGRYNNRLAGSRQQRQFICKHRLSRLAARPEQFECTQRHKKEYSRDRNAAADELHGSSIGHRRTVCEMRPKPLDFRLGRGARPARTSGLKCGGETLMRPPEAVWFQDRIDRLVGGHGHRKFAAQFDHLAGQPVQFQPVAAFEIVRH